MLDTKLKNMRRLKNSIIILCALIPALILVALYPKMEDAMQKRVESIQNYEQQEMEYGNVKNYYLEDNFINYAVEASYYIYGQMLQAKLDTPVDFSVLREYGWINDYYYVNENAFYYAELGSVKQIESDLQEERPETSDGTNGTVDGTSGTSDGTNGTVDGTNETVDVIKKTNTDIKIDSLLHDSKGKLPAALKEEGIKGYVILSYDVYGQLSEVSYSFDDDVEYYSEGFYRRANESIEKYLNNAQFYQSQLKEGVYEDALYDEWEGQTDVPAAYPYPSENGAGVVNQEYTEIDVQNSGNLNTSRLQKYLQVCPKDFSVVVAVTDGSFLWEQGPGYYGYSSESAYMDIGVIWIVAALAVAVAFMAVILPFFKKLNTGWEKLFSMPFEVVLVLTAGGIFGAAGMFLFMCHTNLTELQMAVAEQPINFMGSNLSAETLYGILLAVNFLGWAVLFFADYVVAASLRQFFCNPAAYLKNRLLIIRIWRWLKKTAKKYSKKLYDYVIDIDINDKMVSSIFKIVAVNFVILTVLCCMWFFGIAGLLIYSIILFVLLRKSGEKLQHQFRSILHAANQMAKGDLKITMEEDLGIFAPIGKGLEGVQQGFSKAVAEEAKSQNMKTELITNVSHDLKTPLTAIITYVDLLKKEGITQEERDSYIATIDQKSQRLKVLIEDLFEVSKANSGNIQMHFMDVDVVDLMKQVRLEMEEKIADSDLMFRWNLPQKHLVLSLDGQRTYRIFENLLNNILKYSMPHTRVYIDILEQGDEVNIMFRNISAVELNGDGQNLTERFVRGDASRNTEGSGLGLAIVKSFVELQQGVLNIDVDGDLFKVSIIWKKSER